MKNSFRRGDPVVYTGVTKDDIVNGEKYTVRCMVGSLSGGADGPVTIEVGLVGHDRKYYDPNDFELAEE